MTRSTPSLDSRARGARLKSIALDEGFALAGIAAPDPSRHASFLERWVAAGRHGEMRHLERPSSVARRRDVRLTFARTKSVLVVADVYYRPDPDGVPSDPSRGVIARYARGRDYHRVVEKRLRRVRRRFQEELGHSVPGWAYVDTGPILERELAQRAGLGWFGRNTMLLHPKSGSYFFLGVLLLAEGLEPDTPFEADHCGSCRACLDACPTGALLGRDADGAPVMDARRCISYLTIEHRGPIPVEFRPAIGNRIYGCDICQEVCPFNQRFQREAAEPAYAARGPGEAPLGSADTPPADAGSSAAAPASPPLHPGTDGPQLVELMRMNEEMWDAFSRGSPIRRAGHEGFLRNVAVALGNWGSPGAVPALTEALESGSELVREHAAWALERIGAAGTGAAAPRADRAGAAR